MRETQAIIERVRHVGAGIQQIDLAIDAALTQLEPGQSVFGAPFQQAGPTTWEPYLRMQWIPVDVLPGRVVIELLESFREIVSGLMEVYLSGISARMNNIMKVLTIIATIFIPLTFIAGIYGMNFQNMPELAWRWGYPAVLGLMALAFVGMLIFFRSRKWI